MTPQFPKPALPELDNFQPQKLMALAAQQQISSTWSAPSVEKAVAAIEQGTVEKLTWIDWIFCIIHKARWDNQHPEQAQITSESIWKVALHHAKLQSYLLRGLAFYYGNHDEAAIAPSFVAAFPVFQAEATKDAQLAAHIIAALTDPFPSRAIAILTCTNNLTPKELLLRLSDRMPSSIPAIIQLPREVAQFFAARISPQQIAWIIRCLDEMPQTTQVEAVNHLLTNIPSKMSENLLPLVNWFQNHYGWRSNGSRWHLLSDASKAALRKWVGAINYGDFQSLVDTILKNLDLPDWQQNQLKRRKNFWANYSDRFERIRILIPQSSVRALGKEGFSEDDLLVNDGSAATEVCVFDFGEWHVVEFFRGPGSETRLFKHDCSTQSQDWLFTNSQLSVKQFRCQGGDRHDHAFLWQGYCEKWLRDRGIYPDQDITYFQGLSRDHGRYDQQSGLPEPSDEEQLIRNRKLARWQAEIERLEQQAREYCNKLKQQS